MKYKEKTCGKKTKIAALSQVFSLIIEIFAFSFIVGGMTLFAGVSQAEIVSADSLYPQGCCPEAKDGSVCQEMVESDEELCKTGLVATDCNFVDDCQTGCCYSRQEGICSLNSPKKKCEDTGGVWSSNAQCNIPECQLGCCVIGDQAMIATTRECTKKSAELGFDKNFQPLDADGSCSSKVGLTKKGACLTPSADFSGENSCKFTTKEQCGKTGGDFYDGFLCTAKELNTTCMPAKKTACLEDKDQIYYLDSCGNPANVYDSNKFENEAYWTKFIPASNASVCSQASASCGNCDYSTGSICRDYRLGEDARPAFGDKVCRNLNCKNGKKNGESWCISDYKNTDDPAVAPIGSRWFVGKCVNGEVSIEPCADFNNEVCIQGGDKYRTEAKCNVNDWRSCLAANEKESYEEVADECKKYPGCVMFFDISGNKKYEGLPGFRKNATNAEQGRAGDAGKDSNSVIPWCVPKETPGMVFWNAEQKTNKFGQPEQTGMGNGGSLDETKAICNQASFTCYSRYERDVSAVDKGPWKPKENMECIVNGWTYGSEMDGLAPRYTEEQAEDLNAKQREKEQLFIEALQERCRSLGPCGVTVNVAGELGSNKGDNTFHRTKIDPDGEKGIRELVEENKLLKSYVEGLQDRAGIRKPGSIKSITGSVVAGITGMQVSEALSGLEEISILNPKLPLIAKQMGIQTGAEVSSFEAFGTHLMNIGAAALAAYGIAQILVEIFGLEGEQAKVFTLSLTAGVTASAAVSEFLVGGIFEATLFWFLIIPLFFIFSVFFEGKESKYAVTEYTCEPWSPPKDGDCDSCNKDIRPCSEYRCKSLGSNCQYYNDNGEPGYCSSISGIWSAKISPWKEALTEGNIYTSVTGGGFKIEGSGKGSTVEAWKSIQFGIIVDEPATCRIDNKHTQSFDEMAVEMQLDVTKCETSRGVLCNTNQGTHHKSALVQQIVKENKEQTENFGSATLPMYAGENNYYIRCRNFAGQTNEAEFAVKIIVDDSPDYTAPNIIQFTPESGKYIKMGENSSAVIAWVDEPATCKYSQNQNMKYEEMDKSLLCATDIGSSVLGRFPCHGTLQNLTAGANAVYFQCQDKPEAEERLNSTRIINRNSKEYIVNVCQTGLNITRVYPNSSITAGKSPVELTIGAETSGCIEGGKSTCYFGFDNGTEIAFLETDATLHSQIFSDMPAGEHSIGIRCEDEAGNSDSKTMRAEIILDNDAPAITRAYEKAGEILIRTNEESLCKYSNDTLEECDFSFEGRNLSVMSSSDNLVHRAPWVRNQNYFIKCSDKYNNTNTLCGISLNAFEPAKDEASEQIITEWEYY